MKKRNYYVVDVTQKCNIACRYCFIEHNLKTMNKTEEVKVTKEYLDEVLTFIEKEALETKPHDIHVDFNHSGEPMLVFKEFQYLLEKFREMTARLKSKMDFSDILFSTHTNGYLLNKDRIDYIHENGALIGISVDGDRESHDANRILHNSQGTYDQIAENVRYLFSKEWKFRPGATATLSSKNMDVTRILKHLVQMGFRHINFKIIWTNAENGLAITGPLVKELNHYHSKLFDFFVDEAREKQSLLHLQSIMIPFNRIGGMIAKIYTGNTLEQRCYAGERIIVISQEGDFYPCGPFTYVDKFKIGSLKEGRKPGKFIKMVDDIDGCKDCDVRYLCGGTCPTISDLNDRGHQGIVEDNCHFTKYLVNVIHDFIPRMDKAYPGWRIKMDEIIDDIGFFKYPYFEV